MKVKIDVLNHGQIVSVRIGGADIEEVRGLLGGRGSGTRGARRGDPVFPATPAMIAKGVEAFLAQGDAARLGAALAEVWRAMEQVRSGGEVVIDD